MPAVLSAGVALSIQRACTLTVELAVTELALSVQTLRPAVCRMKI
jgi:hypothetical protein